MQVLVGQRLYALGQRGRTLSYKAAAGRSRGMLSHGTLQRLYTEQSAGPWDDSLLRGLADALDVPHAMVAQAAAASLGQARNRVVWPLKYSQLSDTAWQAPTQPRRQPAQHRERQHRPGRRPGGNPSGPGPDVACARKQSPSWGMGFQCVRAPATTQNVQVSVLSRGLSHGHGRAELTATHPDAPRSRTVPRPAPNSRLGPLKAPRLTLFAITPAHRPRAPSAVIHSRLATDSHSTALTARPLPSAATAQQASTGSAAGRWSWSVTSAGPPRGRRGLAVRAGTSSPRTS